MRALFKILFGVAFVLSVLFAPVWFVGCSEDAAIVGPSSVDGVSRDLTPLYLTYDITPPARGVGQDYGLGEHPTIRAVIIALKKGENGKQDQIRIEDFTYPLAWSLVGDATQSGCSLQNFTTVSAQARCRTPGIHSFEASTVINGAVITSPQPATLPFQ